MHNMVVPAPAMKVYGGLEALFHTFFFSVLDKVKGRLHAPVSHCVGDGFMSGLVVTTFLRFAVGRDAAMKRRRLLFATTDDEVPKRYVYG
jgi:hypothetical protein